MRTLLVGAAALAALASSAAAANFDVNTAADGSRLQLGDISSGSVTVEDCTEGIRLDVLKGVYLPAEDDWAVAGVNVITAGGDALLEKCAGFEVTVVLERGLDLLPVELPTVTIVGGPIVSVPVADLLGVLDTTTLIGTVTHASVLVDEPGI